MTILITDNPVAQAIERVCDKRYFRGAKCEDIITYLNSLAHGVWKNNDSVRRDIDELKSYWIARLG